MIAENSSLRESLVMIQKELVSVLNEKSLSQSLVSIVQLEGPEIYM